MPVPKGYKFNKIHKWSNDEREYLKEICHDRSYKEIAISMSDKFNYEFTSQNIKSAVQRYGLSTGRNGYFKKGHISESRKPIGSERKVNKDGYILVKVAEPNKWELKHKAIYEKHYGKIKKGNVVIFLDGNKSNFDINNLKCITRKQLLVMNRNNLIKEDAELTDTGIGVANLIIKTNEMKKNTK